MKASVYIGVLTGGQIRAELAAALISMSHDGRYRTEIDFIWDRPIPSNRCRIGRKALEWGADYLLMIDADCWPQRNLLDLVEHDLDVVAFPCPIWRPGNPDSPVVMNLTPLDGKRTVDLDGEEPFEVKRGGFSAVLIARRVLEVLWNSFAYKFDEDGLNVGDEDLAFCDAARERGFRIWTAPRYMCEHFKNIGLLRMNNEFARARGGA
jgi:hypothetical protein